MCSHPHIKVLCGTKKQLYFDASIKSHIREYFAVLSLESVKVCDLPNIWLLVDPTKYVRVLDEPTIFNQPCENLGVCAWRR